MGSLSIWHWLIVLLIVVMVFGTKKLKNIGTDLGAAVKGFKDGMKDGTTADQAPPQQVAHQAGVAGAVGGEFLAALARALDGPPVDQHLADVSPLHLLDEFGIGDLLGGDLWRAEVVEHRDQHHGDDDPQNDVFCHIVQNAILSTPLVPPALGEILLAFTPTTNRNH